MYTTLSRAQHTTAAYGYTITCRVQVERGAAQNHGRCLFRRVLLVVLPVRSNADLRALIVCTISSKRVSGSVNRHCCINEQKTALTGYLGIFRLKFIPLVCAVPSAAMDDDAERGRGRLAGLAREETVDMVGRRLAVVENRLGGLVRRRHDLERKFVRKKPERRAKLTWM
jgi:hypothetical protein